jgi:FAD/FMN-containing dehydrogenase
MAGSSGPSEAQAAWRNWAGNQRATVQTVHPASADEVAAVLTSALAAGRRVRPIGSGH